MKFFKNLLGMRGISTENVNMLVAGGIFLAMILWRVFKDIIIKKIKETTGGTYVDSLKEKAKDPIQRGAGNVSFQRGAGNVLWASPELIKNHCNDIKKKLVGVFGR